MVVLIQYFPDINELIYKTEQTHRVKEQSYGCRDGGGVGGRMRGRDS